jgi:hypothetical protein
VTRPTPLRCPRLISSPRNHPVFRDQRQVAPFPIAPVSKQLDGGRIGEAGRGLIQGEFLGPALTQSTVADAELAVRPGAGMRPPRARALPVGPDFPPPARVMNHGGCSADPHRHPEHRAAAGIAPPGPPRSASRLGPGSGARTTRMAPASPLKQNKTLRSVLSCHTKT